MKLCNAQMSSKTIKGHFTNKLKNIFNLKEDSQVINTEIPIGKLSKNTRIKDILSYISNEIDIITQDLKKYGIDKPLLKYKIVNSSYDSDRRYQEHDKSIIFNFDEDVVTQLEQIRKFLSIDDTTISPNTAMKAFVRDGVLKLILRDEGLLNFVSTNESKYLQKVKDEMTFEVRKIVSLMDTIEEFQKLENRKTTVDNIQILRENLSNTEQKPFKKLTNVSEIIQQEFKNGKITKEGINKINMYIAEKIIRGKFGKQNTQSILNLLNYFNKKGEFDYHEGQRGNIITTKKAEKQELTEEDLKYYTEEIIDFISLPSKLEDLYKKQQENKQKIEEVIKNNEELNTSEVTSEDIQNIKLCQ